MEQFKPLLVTPASNQHWCAHLYSSSSASNPASCQRALQTADNGLSAWSPATKMVDSISTFCLRVKNLPFSTTSWSWGGMIVGVRNIHQYCAINVGQVSAWSISHGGHFVCSFIFILSMPNSWVLLLVCDSEVQQVDTPLSSDIFLIVLAL